MKHFVALGCAFLLGAMANGQVANGGFELPSVPTNTFVEAPLGSGWTFSGKAGIANGNTAWSGGAQTGSQYAYVQTNNALSGKFSQTVGGFVTGQSYRIRFWMKKRPGFESVTLGVKRDGVSVMTPTLGSALWIEFATDWFIATSSSATFEFYAVQEPTDKGCAIDEISVDSGPLPPLGLPHNPSFESPAFSPGTFQYNPGGVSTAWQFIGSSGIANGSSSWGSSAATGTQYAFIQNDGAIQQTVGDFASGPTYHAEWMMSRRNGSAGANVGQAIRVLIDGNEVFPLTLHDMPVWKRFGSNPFLPASTSGLLRIEGGPVIGDRSELIDAVRVVQNTDTSANTLSVLVGIPISGDLSSLASSDDQRLVIQGEVNVDRVTSPVRLEVESTAPFLDPNYLAVTVEMSCDLIGVTQKVEVWNYWLQSWTLVQQVGSSSTDQVVHGVIVDNAIDHVDPATGKMRARISINPPGPASRNWKMRVDHVRFSVCQP